MWVDSHAHVGDEALFQDKELILKRAAQTRVQVIVDICTDQKTLARGLELQQNSGFLKEIGVQIALAAAITPHDVATQEQGFFEEIAKQAMQKTLVAIGETGLDYYYEHSPKELQKASLVRHVQLALKTNLPVIFHCRDAFQDLFSLADVEYSSQRGHRSALLHCFTGTLSEARQALDRGWLISLSGIITFKKSEDLRKVVEYIPLDRMCLETDAPFLAPQSKRGKLNEPSFLPEIAEKIAEIKKVPLEEVEENTSLNAISFFSLSK